MSDPFVHAAALRKTYLMGRGIVHALAGVDLTISRSAFAAVIGPSGSGKSTLLHLIGGLDRPSSGGVSVAGLALDDLDENALAAFRRRTVGFIFQSFNLIHSMTALENVAFPMQFAGVPRRRRNAHAFGLLTQVGLADRALHRPNELSGGEQQRVAIARALVNDPPLVLADEPTGNLDSQSGGQVLQLLSDLHRQGRTVIVVSHDPRITRYAVQTVFLLDGRIVAEGEYQEALALAAPEVTLP
ncbi:MAG TPA: ABC transporter ATP-binding protein [Anaerolineales bacterium]|nr:ABC transporter ATP-binding protein [Anaerolineales bacterium]